MRLYGTSSVRGLLALRGGVIAAVVVLWNAIFALAIWLNGGMGRFVEPEAAALSGVACTLMTVFCGAVIWSPRFRTRVLARRRQDWYAAEAFGTVFIIAALLAVISFAWAAGWR